MNSIWKPILLTVVLFSLVSAAEDKAQRAQAKAAAPAPAVPPGAYPGMSPEFAAATGINEAASFSRENCSKLANDLIDAKSQLQSVCSKINVKGVDVYETAVQKEKRKAKIKECKAFAKDCRSISRESCTPDILSKHEACQKEEREQMAGVDQSCVAKANECRMHVETEAVDDKWDDDFLKNLGNSAMGQQSRSSTRDSENPYAVKACKVSNYTREELNAEAKELANKAHELRKEVDDAAEKLQEKRQALQEKIEEKRQASLKRATEKAEEKDLQDRADDEAQLKKKEALSKALQEMYKVRSELLSASAEESMMLPMMNPQSIRDGCALERDKNFPINSRDINVNMRRKKMAANMYNTCLSTAAAKVTAQQAALANKKRALTDQLNSMNDNYVQMQVNNQKEFLRKANSQMRDQAHQNSYETLARAETERMNMDLQMITQQGNAKMGNIQVGYQEVEAKRKAIASSIKAGTPASEYPSSAVSAQAKIKGLEDQEEFQGCAAGLARVKAREDANRNPATVTEQKASGGSTKAVDGGFGGYSQGKAPGK